MGLGGCNFSFIRAMWDFVEVHFWAKLVEFHLRGRLNKEIHPTFLIRIPKFSILLDLGEYKPIGLLGCIYKLLAKVLANRLK